MPTIFNPKRRNAIFINTGGTVSPTQAFTNTKSLQYDGVDEYIKLADYTDSINDFSQPWSISWWAKWNYTPSFDCFFQFGKTTTTVRYILAWAHSTGIGYSVSNSGSIGIDYNIGTNLNDGNWHHIVFTGDGTTSGGGKINVYIDGVLNTDTPTATGISANQNTMNNIGRGASTTGRNFNGNIDELSIYDFQLDATQVSNIYNSGTPNNLSDLNPIAWYRMGDNSTYQTPQILMPENTNKDKVSNWSLELDGVDDYITMGDVLNFDYNEPFTISAWIDLEASVSSFMPVIAKQESSGNYRGYHFYITKSGSNYYLKFSFNNTLSNTIVVQGTTDLIGLGWVNIVATYDGSTNASGLKFYINGSIETSSILNDTLGSNTTVSTAPLNIGRRNLTTIYYKGKVDEVSIYSSELNATQVSDIFNSGEPTTISGATAYWKLGEQSKFTDNWLVPNSALSNYSKYSFSLDGADDKVSTGINTGTNDVSICCWIKTTATYVYTASQCAFGGRNTGSGDNYTLGRLGSAFSSPDDTKVRVFNTLGTTKLNDGNWHFIAYTHDYTTKETKAYVDGNTTPEATVTFPGYSAGFNMVMGNNGLTFYFNGNVDECAYFNSVLTGSELNTIYNSGTPTTIPSGAVAHWRMGEDASFDGTNWTLPQANGLYLTK